ncbi:hypothetical protein [Hymenobacter negativus]|uniref:Uncharacterized protein n=1 Tax=Hymenobacter negativus TaxID=2795026 RepID=A0ABS3QNR3_9BACT|nr:hypothetical protein [Hymenobacter negativus]MBO2012742.1 hypothetical protein [Hymenobacter negativus]
MLTVAKLTVLIKYHWDLRRFHKQGTLPEKELLAGVDWHATAELLQDLRLYHKNLVSPAYAAQIHANLLAACADEATAQTLLGYASTL